METEIQIVYQILNVLRSHEVNSDEVIDVREIRAYMRTHRAALLKKFKGEPPLSCYQSLNDLSTTEEGGIYNADIPAVIDLPNNLSYKVAFDSGREIPVVDKASFNNQRKIIHQKHLPVAYAREGKVYVYPGADSELQFPGLKSDIDAFIAEPVIDFMGILFNPDDSNTYDWETDNYPFPAELIKNLKMEVLRIEFGISLKMNPDQITNSRQDELRYHDQGKLKQ